MSPHSGDQFASRVVPAKAGIHSLDIGRIAGPCQIPSSVVMGPRLRGDDKTGKRSAKFDMTARPQTVVRVLTAFCVLVAFYTPAAAERLIASISNHRVMVTSSFTGDELVLFGGIEQDQTSQPRRGGYDLIVTVSGPRQTLVTFQKQRVLGIWVNADSRVFENAPSYYAVLSNRPLDAIANTETLRRMQLGLDNLVLLQRASVNIADSSPEDPFRLAFLRIKGEHLLYRQETNGVTLLTSAFYRAAIPLPAEVPVGNYEVDVKLFADGAQIARANSAFEIYKAGFEQVVTAAARDHGLLYGVLTALLALATGWFASVLFRRD
jgi:uncharacterized protein (TIGR02186 family)